MTQLTRDTSFKPVAPVHSHSYVDVEDDANEIYAGAFVQRTTTGRVVIVGDTGGLGVGPVVGVNERNVPDQAGKTYSGPLERPTAKLYQGQYERPIATSNPVTDADMFKTVYAANNHDVTNDATKPVLGIMVGINNDAGTCTVLIGAVGSRALSALGIGEIPIPLNSFVEDDGTPLALFVDGASPTPGTAFLDSKAMGVRWNNHATPGKIVTSVPIPVDLDPTRDVFVLLTASKIGSSADDQPTFGVEAFFHPVGAAYDADADAGGATNAMTNAGTKVVEVLAATIDAADVPSPAGSSLSMTLTLQPQAGELDFDDLVLHSARLAYTRAI
jgi:hypothetical protein